MDNLPPADDGGKSSFVEMTSSSVQNVFEKLVQAGLARRAENTVSLFGSSKSSLMPEEETTNPEGTISGDKNKQPIDEGNECMDLGEVESFQCYSHASAENISPTTEIEDGPLDEITILFEGRSSDNSYLTKRKRFWGAIPIRKTKQEPPETIELHEEKPTSSLRALADYLRTRKRFSLPASALLKIDVNESRISEAINQIDQDIIFEGFCLFNGLTDEKFNQRHSTMMESDFESQPAARSSFTFLPESETTAREIATNMTVHDTYMSYLQRSIKIEDVSPPQSASPKRARPSPSAAPKEKWPERYPQSTLRLKKGVDPIQTPISSAVELEDMTKTVEILTERLQEERSQREASEMELNRKIFLICQQMENLVGAVQHHVDKNSELSKIVNEVGAKLQSLDKDMKEIKETPRQAPRMSRLDPTALFARNSASTLNPTTTEKRPRRRPRLNPSKRRSSELDVRRAITPNNAKKLRLSSQPVPVEDPATIPLMPTTANNPYGYEPVIPEDERAVEKVAEEDDDDVEGMTFETFNINSKCPFCWCEEHIADDCEHIQRVEEREDFAEHHYLCLMCLRYHPLSTCDRANKVCSYCGQTTHHEAVCPSDLHRVQCNNIQRRLCPLVSRNKHSSRRN